MPLFSRYIAIDWSGAATATEGVDIAIVEAGQKSSPAVVRPPAIRGRKRWSRQACEEWLRPKLRAAEPRTLVLVDAGFAYPSGAARTLVGAASWMDLVKAMGQLYRTHRTARAVGQYLNDQFRDGAPFRFDAGRSDARWYARYGIPYYRQTELLVPQAISEFYLGSGGAVGFHTITFLATLDDLIRRRKDGETAFDVWPYEVTLPRGQRHVVVECYPALCRASVAIPKDDRLTEHEADATVACEWARQLDSSDTLSRFFEMREVPVGRDTRCTWQAQIQEEGWILGVPFGARP